MTLKWWDFIIIFIIACPFSLTIQVLGGFMKNLVLFHMFLLFVALSHFDEVFVNPIEIQFMIFVWWQHHDFFCDLIVHCIHQLPSI